MHLSHLSRTTLALAVGATVFVVSAAPAQAAGTTPTAFALSGSGYGTRLVGGQVPTGSDTTAFQAVGCTNLAGKAHENHVTTANLPGLGTAYEVTTDVTTQARTGTVSSTTRTSVERIVLGEGALGTVEINAVSTVATALHDAKGFDTAVRSRVGSIVYTDATGASQELEIPTPGQPLEVPGIATIAIGNDASKTTASKALAVGDALVVDVTATGTKLKVAHSVAEVARDVTRGLFQGRSAGLRADAVDGNADVGYQPLSLMPCQGTEGKTRRKDVDRVTLGDNLVARGASSSQQADQTRSAAWGRATGRVAHVDLGDGQVVIEAVRAQANVSRSGSGLDRSSAGTRIGSITIDGSEAEFPPTDVIEVPGVVRIERNLQTRLKYGLEVIGLRLTLLDGSGATVDLGIARLVVRKAH